MASSINPQQCHGQCSTRNTGKKILMTALTIASATSLMATEAFQPPPMVASVGNSRASSTKLNYVVYSGDRSKANNIEIEKPKKTKTIKPKSNNVNHGYIVANHDNERSFWLHALQNLEPSSTSTESNQSLWTKIACAYGPKEFRETFSSRIEPKGADLVRVGDGDLDIALAVPSDSWDPSNLENKNVVLAAKEVRGNRQLVTIRVNFPEGSSFDKDAYSFEDELTAVIGQVRLLEQTANDKLSKIET